MQSNMFRISVKFPFLYINYYNVQLVKLLIVNIAPVFDSGKTVSYLKSTLDIVFDKIRRKRGSAFPD